MDTLHTDILTVKHGIIGHQVNCMGVMGAGLALSIRKAYPQAYDDYKEAHSKSRLFLGNIIVSEISTEPPFFIMHMCGQHLYGREGQYTNYKALEICLKKIHKFRDVHYGAFGKYGTFGGMLPIYFPYRIGCGLAGGNWKTVLEIIERIIPDAIICKI